MTPKLGTLQRFFLVSFCTLEKSIFLKITKKKRMIGSLISKKAKLLTETSNLFYSEEEDDSPEVLKNYETVTYIFYT